MYVHVLYMHIYFAHMSMHTFCIYITHMQNMNVFIYTCVYISYINIDVYILRESESQSCPTLCDPMDSTVHGILHARILESVAFPFSRGSSQPRDRTQVSRMEGGFFTSRATREAQEYWSG